MKIAFELQNEDIVLANYGHALLRGARKQWVIFSIIGLFAVSIGIYLILASGDKFSIFILFLTGIYLPLSEPVNRCLRSRKLMKDIPRNERGMSFVFEESGVEYDNHDLFSANYKWELIKYVVKFRGMYSIYPKVDGDYFYSVPNRAFKDVEEVKQFENILKNKGIEIKLLQ